MFVIKVMKFFTEPKKAASELIEKFVINDRDGRGERAQKTAAGRTAARTRRTVAKRGKAL